MLRDVFYYGRKPNVHPREKPAQNLEDAREQSTTEHFWIINEYTDYANIDWDFDFDFLPDEEVWHSGCNNAWPSEAQKDSGTWLCPKGYTDNLIYRTDVEPLKRFENTSNWVLLDKVDKDKFDFGWHPDPTDPPYIYKWGCKWYDCEIKHVLEYHVPGATEEKWMDEIVALEPDYDNMVEVQPVDKDKWDISWRPDPREPPYIYVWGNKYIDGTLKSTLEYHVPGATEYKYMTELVDVLPEYDRWEIPRIQKTTFDFTWRPDPREPPYIYSFPTQHQTTGGPRYIVPGATEVKYIDSQTAKRLPNKTDWEIPNNVNTEDFDFSWHPDESSPPYIYEFGTQWQPNGGPRYVVQGATEIKYIDVSIARAEENKTNWYIPENIDQNSFDFSWHPNNTDEPYIYQFGTQHQKTGGPRYVVENATEVKYIDIQIAKKLPNKEHWQIPNNIDVSNFDFSWHPDDTEAAYIYEFGTQWQKTGGPRYIVDSATEIKYVEGNTAKANVDMTNWDVPANIDKNKFDFSWHPDDTEAAYIYEFGTQWQKTGGPRYIVPGATETKFIDIISAHRLPTLENYTIPSNIKEFDYSWHPDDTEPPYIYEFATIWNDRGGPVYTVQGATEKKYIDKIVATLKTSKTNWQIPNGIDTSNFDFSWVPHPEAPAYIYQFGTQWQKTGGPRYVVEGATEVMYVDIQRVKKLPNKKLFEIVDEIEVEDFDYSWHPDETEEPYIYVFGNTQYPAEIMPTVKYTVEGATQVKYIYDIIATLKKTRRNWVVPRNIDTTKFDFSWVPNPKDPPYIYEFGTQWQETGGPKYVVPGATDIKYIKEHKATIISSEISSNWTIPKGIDVSEFDFSWHPNEKDTPYIYQFGTQHQKTGGPRYIVEGATEVKFISSQYVTKFSDVTNWQIPENIDTADFDFSWHPDETEPPYIYEFGTQWQETGGPVYKVPGATEVKYLKQSKAKTVTTKGKAKVSRKNWVIPRSIDDSNFDYSWHPDSKDLPYIYQFGTQHQRTGGPKYVVPGATEIKFVTFQKVIALPDKKNWEIPDNLDTSKFDFSWHPDDTEPPYRYEFNTQWQKNGGPVYVVKGATETKYMHDATVVALPTDKNWEIPWGVKVKLFDYSWHPDNTDEPYIYVFGNNLYPAEVMTTVKYVVPGAKQVKFVKDITATLDTNYLHWQIPENIDKDSFDFSWVPDPTSPPYIYEFATIWNDRGGPVYWVPGAEDKKYIENVKAKTLSNKTHWKVNIPVIDDGTVFSWVPHPEAPPYIYVFGNQWNSPEKESTLEYHVPNATEIKYVHELTPKVAPNKTNFEILHPIVDSEFDYSWRPDPGSPPYIYVFGNNQYPGEIMPTVKYYVEGATEEKYVNDIVAKLDKDMTNWQELIPVDRKRFDYSWVPNPKDPPYIYVFGNQWNRAELESTIEYHVPGATEYKYINDVVAYVLPNKSKFKVLISVVEDSFDFSWRPNPKDPAYIYVWGNQWHKAEKESTIEYHVRGATDRKYMQDVIAEVAENFTNWEISNKINVDTFDFSWRPDPDSPPYIYQFGTLADDNDGPRYVHPDNTGEVVRLLRTERKTKRTIDLLPTSSMINEELPKYYITTTLDDLVRQHSKEVFWALNKNINYDNFDFNWRPSIEQARYVHVFGSPESEMTHTYFVSGKMYLQGHRDFNFVDKDIKVDNEYLATLFKPSDAFYIDRGNIESNERYEQLKEIFPNIVKTRYLNSWADTIARCIKRCNTQLAWILNSELDYTDFDFKYYPNPWQMKMVHVFGTQWSHWGTTYMVNKDTFAEDTKYIKVVEHLSNLNFVKNRKARATNNLYDIYLIDHGNSQTTDVKSAIERKLCNKKLTVVPYTTNYITTIRKIIEQCETLKEHYIWITSSVCDYTKFDFSYICDPFAKNNLHVFPSGMQKFGDTFLVDVNRMRELLAEMVLLEDYTKINYNNHQRVPRYNPPVFITTDDTHSKVTNTEFDFPYALFKTVENESLDINYKNPISLWSDDSKNIEILSTGGTALIVPKEAKLYVENELYDYPYINKAEKLLVSKPLDIVFLSNGESCAEENYKHLLHVTKNYKNRVVRVDSVNGRAAAYHAAAEASETPWMFTVFAKLKVNNRFDFNWQPDRLQIPKHYIFNALNPVNNLEYGHQGMIAYNKKLTLANPGRGLDFTLDDPHDTIDILSGIATFNTDPYSTWRTAFREVIKLKSDFADISYERLQTWLTVGEGEYAQDCLQGAKDGVEYYDSVKGDPDQLKLTYEWSWLKKYYDRKYK